MLQTFKKNLLSFHFFNVWHHFINFQLHWTNTSFFKCPFRHKTSCLCVYHFTFLERQRPGEIETMNRKDDPILFTPKNASWKLPWASQMGDTGPQVLQHGLLLPRMCISHNLYWKWVSQASTQELQHRDRPNCYNTCQSLIKLLQKKPNYIISCLIFKKVY